MLEVPTIRRLYFSGDAARVSFIEAYKEVFSKPPYDEDYETDDVQKGVLNAHLPNYAHAPEKDQCVIIAEAGDPRRVVAFGCAHGALAPTEPSVREFLLSREDQLPFLLDRAVFMSELGTLADYRLLGLGKLLVLSRLVWAQEIGYTHYLMRTADEGSNSAQLYISLGSHEANFKQYLENASVANAPTKSHYRSYYWGKIAPNVHELRDRQRQSFEERLSDKLGQAVAVITLG